MSGEKKHEIIIDLDNSRSAKVFGKNELIQWQTFEKIYYKLYELTNKTKYYSPVYENHELQHQHEAILVSGSRGSGKTTLIFNLLDKLKHKTACCHDNANHTHKKDRWKNLKLYPLGMIDPTLLGDRENIFVTIISKIKKAVENQEEKRGRDDLAENNGFKRYNAWRERLKELAIGISMLHNNSDKHTSDHWGDEELFLQEGLRKARHGLDLEYDFHKFVEESAKLLDASALVLAFDDIDTDFKRGWPVLEVLRRYLTTPHLITVICGDIEMYTQLVTKHQYENYKELISINEKRSDNKHSTRNSSYDQSIDTLVEQYMQKLFKIDNRFELATIKQLSSNKFEDTRRIVFRFKPLDAERIEDTAELPMSTLELLLKKYAFAICSDALKQNAMDIIWQQPARTVIRLANASLAKLRKSRIEQIEKWAESQSGQTTPLPEDSDEPLSEINAKNALRAVITDIFAFTLLNYGYRKSDLNEIDSPASLKRLVYNLNRLDLLVDGYGLKPEFLDSTSILLMVLGMHYAEAMRKTPASYFDYFIVVGLAREMAVQWPFDGEKDKDKQQQMKRYIDFTGLNTIEKSLQTARKFLAFYRAETKGKAIKCGTLRLHSESVENGSHKTLFEKHFNLQSADEVEKGMESNQQGYMWKFVRKINAKKSQNQDYNLMQNRANQEFQYFFNTIYTLDSAIVSFHKYFAKLPFSVNVTRQGEAIPYVSIHNLLGAISLILETGKDANEVIGTDRIEEALYQYSQIRLFSTFDSSDKAADVENTDFHDKLRIQVDVTIGDDDKKEIRKGFKWFSRLLFRWVSEWKKAHVDLPPDLLAKIWARFYYNLKRIDDAMSNQHLYLGNVLYRFIIAYLNSILVELLALHHDDPLAINLRNPVLSDVEFVDNLKIWRQIEGGKELAQSGKEALLKQNEQEREKYKFFKLVFSCPLWGMYLSHRADKDNGVCETPVNDGLSHVFGTYHEIVGMFLKPTEITIELKLSSESEIVSGDHYWKQSVEIESPTDIDIFKVRYVPSNVQSVTEYKNLHIFRNLYTPFNSVLVRRSAIGAALEKSNDDKKDSIQIKIINRTVRPQKRWCKLWCK
jgi:hypothetical protein